MAKTFADNIKPYTTYGTGWSVEVCEHSRPRWMPSWLLPSWVRISSRRVYR